MTCSGKKSSRQLFGRKTNIYMYFQKFLLLRELSLSINIIENTNHLKKKTFIISFFKCELEQLEVREAMLKLYFYYSQLSYMISTMVVLKMMLKEANLLMETYKETHQKYVSWLVGMMEGSHPCCSFESTDGKHGVHFIKVTNAATNPEEF